MRRTIVASLVVGVALAAAGGAAYAKTRTVKLKLSDEEGGKTSVGRMRFIHRRGGTFVQARFKNLAPNATYTLRWDAVDRTAAEIVADRKGRATLRTIVVPDEARGEDGSTVSLLDEESVPVCSCGINGGQGGAFGSPGGAGAGGGAGGGSGGTPSGGGSGGTPGGGGGNGGGAAGGGSNPGSGGSGGGTTSGGNTTGGGVFGGGSNPSGGGGSSGGGSNSGAGSNSGGAAGGGSSGGSGPSSGGGNPSNSGG